MIHRICSKLIYGKVPFKPNGKKPVFCLDCFKKKKAEENGTAPVEEKPAQEAEPAAEEKPAEQPTEEKPEEKAEEKLDKAA